MSDRNFKMPFGKYKGETLEEIYIEDIGYLEWLLDTISDEDPLRLKIHQCFKEMRKVRIS